MRCAGQGTHRYVCGGHTLHVNLGWGAGGALGVRAVVTALEDAHQHRFLSFRQILTTFPLFPTPGKTLKGEGVSLGQGDSTLSAEVTASSERTRQ